MPRLIRNTTKRYMSKVCKDRERGSEARSQGTIKRFGREGTNSKRGVRNRKGFDLFEGNEEGESKVTPRPIAITTPMMKWTLDPTNSNKRWRLRTLQRTALALLSFGRGPEQNCGADKRLALNKPQAAG